MRHLVSRNYWVYVEPEFEKVKKIMKGSGGCGEWLKVEGILKYQTSAENRIYKAMIMLKALKKQANKGENCLTL